MKTEKYYNILFPIWLLIWLPSPLWIVLIPANYVVDRFVLFYSLNIEEKKAFCKRHAWKICLMGFLADLLGSLFLFGIVLLSGDNYELANGVSMNPFKDLLSFGIVAFAVLFSAIVIYLGDLKILKKCGLENEQAKRSALFMAILTAPYLFLFPSNILYR
jgi:hypothetical protein